MSRKIKFIVITSTETQNVLSKEVWKKIGDEAANPTCHFFLFRAGTCQQLKSLEKNTRIELHRRESVVIGYEGGLNHKGKHADTRNKKQKRAMFALITLLKMRYPNAQVIGYHDFEGSSGSNPGFNVQNWLHECEKAPLTFKGASIISLRGIII